jgi:hypothetical protein
MAASGSVVSTSLTPHHHQLLGGSAAMAFLILTIFWVCLLAFWVAL